MPMTPLAGLDRTSPTFKTDLDTFFLTNLPQFVTEANALEAAVDADKTAAADSAVAAAGSAVAADISADAAALSEANALSSANAAAMVASPFVSSQTVAVGDVRYSPVDMLTYRAKTAGVRTTDPSADATNWARISGNLVGADLKTVGGVSLVGAGDVPIPSEVVPGDVVLTTRPLSAPGYLLCNGAEYLAASYPDLVGVVTPGLAPWAATSRTMPSARNWTGIAYGNSTFVAVSSGSSDFATSPDGITWTVRASPSNTSWTQIIFANGIFIATNVANSFVATSSDGVNWNIRTTPTSNYYGIAYGNGVFVLVARESSAAATSPDGITWTARTLPSSTTWGNVAFGNGVFVAVAGGGTVAATSTDGISWTARTLPTSAPWAFVTFGNGIFVAHTTTSATTFATSTDGITWTSGTFPSAQNWSEIAYGNGVFLTTAYANNVAATSTDGRTWTSRTLPSTANWQAVGYGNGVFAGAGNSTTSAFSYNSFDATKIKVPLIANANESVNYFLKAST